MAKCCIFVLYLTYKSYAMKKVNLLFLGLVALVQSTSFAHNARNPLEDLISVSENADMVRVSVLNQNMESYALTIYRIDGTIVYKGRLGKDMSLGKTFDFSNAVEGTYNFKFVSDNGNKVVKSIKIG